jgi:hypothetical protein
MGKASAVANPEDYEWGALPASKAAKHSSQASSSDALDTFVVCYCNSSGVGWRWEDHLTTGEIFYVNDNANLSELYGLSKPSPTPDVTATINASLADSANQERTVEAFYAAVSRHDDASAYTMLSSNFQSYQSFDSFRRGYATTESVSVEAHAIGGHKVQTILTAIDYINGREVTSIYDGTWKLAWSPARNRYLLDDANFAKR